MPIEPIDDDEKVKTVISFGRFNAFVDITFAVFVRPFMKQFH
jgi:hypothetical protein